ncbi:unnamed protein product [Pylaiella littoralis]
MLLFERPFAIFAPRAYRCFSAICSPKTYAGLSRGLVTTGERHDMRGASEAWRDEMCCCRAELPACLFACSSLFIFKSRPEPCLQQLFRLLCSGANPPWTARCLNRLRPP